MSDLSIDTRKTIDVGKQVADKAMEFNRILDRISSINSELNGYWEGQDAAKYSSAVQTQNEEMKKQAKTLADSAIFLQEVGQRYEKARNENYSRIVSTSDSMRG